MLRQLQSLRLIVRLQVGAVERLRPRQHVLVDQPADDLAVFEDERHFMAAHFQHGAAAGAAGGRMAEAGSKKPA
jgi:hypothetical protein